MENKKWKGTTGVFDVHHHETARLFSIKTKEGHPYVLLSKEDHLLLVDSLHTIQKCEMMPSELLENLNQVLQSEYQRIKERDELLNVIENHLLKMKRFDSSQSGDYWNYEINQAQQLISKIKGHE